MYNLKTELSNVNFVTEIVRKSPLIIIAHLRFKLSSVCFKIQTGIVYLYNVLRQVEKCT